MRQRAASTLFASKSWVSHSISHSSRGKAWVRKACSFSLKRRGNETKTQEDTTNFVNTSIALWQGVQRSTKGGSTCPHVQGVGAKQRKRRAFAPEDLKCWVKKKEIGYGSWLSVTTGVYWVQRHSAIKRVGDGCFYGCVF